MPRQNRVTPCSSLIADPARGLFMGNRGCLHDAGGNLVRPHRGRLWITCLTGFRGRKRALMQPGRYTELFFLDEAVAFAAGHRPCAECRRADYRRFRAAWAAAELPEAPRARDMDDLLHKTRLDGHQQRRYRTKADHLPDGAFVLGADGAALLLSDGGALPYAPAGYGGRRPRPGGMVTVLTPAPLIAVLAAGYQPLLHPSADQGAKPSPMSQKAEPDPTSGGLVQVEEP